MNKKVIAVNRVEKEVLDILKEEVDVTFFEDIHSTENHEFVHALQEADGVIGLDLQVNDDLLDLAPNVKIFSNVSVDYNNLDIEAMTKRNVMGTHTPGVLDGTVADNIFVLLVSSACIILGMIQFDKS